jgi:hypothetical protein
MKTPTKTPMKTPSKTPMKTLDQKLDILRKNPDADTFIIADARDADMAWGVSSPGLLWPPDPARPAHRSMSGFCEQIRAELKQAQVDIMLASVFVMARLAHEERLFAKSPVTPAIRANDTSDVWAVRGARYREKPSRPFAGCHLEEVQYGSLTAPRKGAPAVNLGLYSMTFNNDLDADRDSLEAYRDFRARAERLGFRYFLEVFDPNVDARIPAGGIPAFVNDSILRTLAAVPPSGRPEFLKIAWHGPRWMEELRNYDPTLVVGILGGGAGTTLDAFKMLADAKKHGARVALYGRKIKESEEPLAFIKHLRLVADGRLKPAEAVRSYHADLKKQGIPPKRPLADDLRATDNALLRY